MHRAENQQKEFNKQSRKKNNTFNTYAKPKFLSKKIKSTLPKVQKVQNINSTFTAQSDQYKISIPLTHTGDIVLKEITPKAFKKAKSKKTKDTYNLTVSLPNKENSRFTGQAKVAKDNTVVYKDYQENTDVAVQAFEDSIRILTVLNDADAPTEYKYKINVPAGGHMKKEDDGSITILDKDENFLGGFTPAWALDKNGKKVPTHYEIMGNTLIQVVEHLSINATYPVVADPYYGRKAIRHAYWRYSPQSSGNSWYHYKLTVLPTAWARGIGAKWHVLQYGWNELKGKVSYLNYNSESMRKQYICHVYFAWLQHRSEYHLEHWRPNTSWNNVLSHSCNPPGYM